MVSKKQFRTCLKCHGRKECCTVGRDEAVESIKRHMRALRLTLADLRACHYEPRAAAKEGAK